MSHHPQVIVFDIETCPQRPEGFSAAQRARFDKAFRRRRGKSIHESLGKTKATVRALSPYLGWICCISVCRYVEGAESPRPTHSYACAEHDGEADLLARFWNDMSQVHDRVTWVSFNGKNFDAPYLRLRSLASEVEPTREGLLNTHKWRDTPHTDIWRYAESAGLADYCDLLGVSSPKGDMDGSDVWAAVQEGRLADVTRYCEKDAFATLRCYLRSRHTFA
jgi:DNA polymerase elongation subunit (family B)